MLVFVKNMNIKLEEMMKDENFLKYLYRDFKRQKKIKECKDKINIMMNDMKVLSKELFIKKYGSPQQTFAKLKWELYKAKNDLIDCDKCKTYHKDDGECVELKRRT